jgi:hypothetical protein
MAAKTMAIADRPRVSLGERATELVAILFAEPGGVEQQQKAVQPHHVVSGDSPRRRAKWTSSDIRRISARAQASPNGVMR